MIEFLKEELKSNKHTKIEIDHLLIKSKEKVTETEKINENQKELILNIENESLNLKNTIKDLNFNLTAILKENKELTEILTNIQHGNKNQENFQMKHENSILLNNIEKISE